MRTAYWAQNVCCHRPSSDAESPHSIPAAPWISTAMSATETAPPARLKARYLEEIAFEVVSEQNEGNVTEKALRMGRRGTNREGQKQIVKEATEIVARVRGE